MTKRILGWDVGGAHLKAALVTADGQLLWVKQQPCPLWQGVDRLHAAVARILAELSGDIDCHAITMTGELVDGFTSREQGVHAIVEAMQQRLASKNILIYAGAAGFIEPGQIDSARIVDIASANWFASAELAATIDHAALFVDIGSTTTDLLRLEAGRVANVGYSDYQRLISGELLYTGVVRTAVMAVASTAHFNGHDLGLMAEHFATMADVYRLTGELSEAHDQTDTADGAAKTAEASARRLSRMTGYEFAVADMPLWRQFARHLRQRQKQLVEQAVRRQLQRAGQGNVETLIGAGIGRFLLRELADDLPLAYRDFADWLPQPLASSDYDAGDCAPAVAVALLAARLGD